MTAKRTPSWLGDENAALALDALLERGPLSRAGIAAATDVSKQTATQIVSRLQERGLIVEAGAQTQGRGPAAARYAVRDDIVCGVAVNVDQDGVSSQVIDAFGRPGPVARVAAGQIDADRSAAGDVAGAVLRACREAGVELPRVGHVCVGVPSSVDARADRLSSVEALPGWSREHVRARIEEALGCRVLIDNDVNLAAIAERVAGDASPDAVVALIWLGRGIGLSLDIGGRILRGASGGAGEIGHLRVPGALIGATDEEIDLEDAVGAQAVSALLAADPSGVRLEDALAGASLPDGVVEALASRLAQAVIPVLGVIDPDHLVFGGPIAVAGGTLLAESCARFVASRSRWAPRIEVTAVPADPVLHGAAETLRRRLRDDLLARARTADPGLGDDALERRLLAVR